MSYQKLFTIYATAKEAAGSLSLSGKRQPDRKPPERSFISWAQRQLNIQPYQHLLEVGYGAGHLIEEVAQTLRIGFIAGIESSISLYQQAYRRNKRHIHQQLIQLHIGELYDLSYPSHYFHTVYGTNIHLWSKDIFSELLRLSRLLKDQGRLVLLLKSGRNDANIYETALQLREACSSAGLIRTHIEHHPTHPESYLAITGIKQ